MRCSFTAVLTYALILSSPLLAQTTAAVGTGAGTTATGGLADWWWVILVAILIVAAIWYFASRQGRL